MTGASNVLGEASPHNSGSYRYDLFAPGGERRSASVGISTPFGVWQYGADANADDILCCVGSQAYCFLTLGSAAAPHTAAAAAIAKSYLPDASPEVVRRLLVKSTQPFTTPNLTVSQAAGGVLSLKKLKTNLLVV